MHDLRTIFSYQLRAVVVVAALGSLVPLQVAAEVADPAFNRFRSQVVGNSVNFSFGGNGTPLAGAGNSTGIGVTGGVDVGRPVSINTKHGPVTGTVKQKISNAAIGKAFGRAAAVLSGPAMIAFIAIPVIYDWLQDADVQHDGTGFVQTDSTGLCTVAPCYSYQLPPNTGPVRVGTFDAVCQAHIASLNNPPYSFSYAYVTDSLCYYNYTSPSSGSGSGFFERSRTSVAPSVPEATPITGTALEDALATANPSPEALAELYKLGGQPNFNTVSPVPDLVDTLRAEFEARSPESVDTTTTDSPTETKTEEKTCATYTEIIGSTLYLREDCSTETTTQAKDPETGLPVGDPVTTTTEQSSTTPDPATKEEEAAEDPCVNAPNRVACIELGTPEGDVPTSTRNVDFEQEELFGGGTCPTDQTFTFRATVLPITNYAQACDMLQTYVRPMAILLAFVAGLMILTRGMPE